MFFQHNPLAAIWTIFAVFWFLPGIFGKRTIHGQTPGSLIRQLVWMVAVYVLFAHPDLGWELLNRRLVPEGMPTTAFGFGLLVAGLLFAGWAQVSLGGKWTTRVTIKQNHALVCSGPYRIVRHPIYTGLVVALLGTAITLGPLRCFLGVLVAAIALRSKSLGEEEYMVRQFGDEYTRYRREVKAFVPYIW